MEYVTMVSEHEGFGLGLTEDGRYVTGTMRTVPFFGRSLWIDEVHENSLLGFAEAMQAYLKTILKEPEPESKPESDDVQNEEITHIGRISIARSVVLDVHIVIAYRDGYTTDIFTFYSENDARVEYRKMVDMAIQVARCSL